MPYAGEPGRRGRASISAGCASVAACRHVSESVPTVTDGCPDAERRRARGGGTMKRSRERILTTHAGSLVRPPEIIEVLKAEAFGEPYDQEAFAQRLRTAVVEVVRRQAEVGIDIPSDGEFGKVGW